MPAATGSHASRHPPPRPTSLRHLALRRIIRIPLINRQIPIPLTSSISHTRPLLHRPLPHPQPLPNPLILPTLSLIRNPHPTLEMVKYPQPHHPRRNHKINQTRLFPQKERPLGMHLRSKFLQLPQKLLPHSPEPSLVARRLNLQEPMPRRNYSGRTEIRPDPRPSPLIRV